MGDPPKADSSEWGSASRSPDDLEILTQILAALRRLDHEGQERMLNTVATFLGMGPRPSGAVTSVSRHTGDAQPAVEAPVPSETSFSEDRSLSPKQFMFEKQPKTDVERVACLAYYLTHYRGLPHFKTLDVSTLNTEAAQPKFSNATVAVDNATKQQYLVPSTKGAKQLSALGEQFVLALPDRERARDLMSSARPRRRARKSAQLQVDDQE